MSAKVPSFKSKSATDSEYAEESVDPRVQGELEKLNTATDDINKLEVDLDEARAEFRRLLCETTVQIDALGKKLGSCVERARPYYEARIKAKEALLETQQAAVRFERANSAHAAAKEMVFLAEEGLKTEGRTFDHAWQEMLNHATMRVNESELERTLSEKEHRRTSKNHQQTEHIVQKLQNELKRSIAKSRPYFEQKALYNQDMEKQKHRVKILEERVAQAKANYAEALRNLEQISDEIHKIRSNESILYLTGDPLGVRGNGVGAESPRKNMSRQSSEKERRRPNKNSSSSPSTLDSDSGEEFMKLPNSLKPDTSPILPKVDDPLSNHISPYLGLSNLANGMTGRRNHKTTPKPKPPEKPLKEPSPASIIPSVFASPKKGLKNPFLPLKNPCKPRDSGGSATGPVQTDPWSATDLGDSSTSEPASGSPQKQTIVNGDGQVQNNIPYHPLVDAGEEEPNIYRSALEDITPFREAKVDCGAWVRNSPFSSTQDSAEAAEEVWTEVSLNDDPETPTTASLFKKVSFLNTCSRTRNDSYDDERRNSGQSERLQRLTAQSISAHSTPAKTRNSRLDSLPAWMSRSMASGDSDSLMGDAGPTTSGRPIGSLGSRRQSLDTLLWSVPASERVKGLLSQGIMMLNISSLTERRSSEPRTENPSARLASANTSNWMSSTQNATLDPKQPSKPSKKLPSPLEKSLTYLNAEDDSASDSESLASMEMLTDDQISSLMLDHNINEVCVDVLGTPIAEVLPEYPSKRQQT